MCQYQMNARSRSVPVQVVPRALLFKYVTASNKPDVGTGVEIYIGDALRLSVGLTF